MKPANFWTEFELQAIERHYAKHGTKFVDEIIFAHHGWRRGYRNVMQKANKMGFKYEGPNRGMFRAGFTPHNKGRKMSPELRAKCAPTMFRPAKTPEEINYVTKKAKALSNTANTITNLGKLELEAIRMNRSSK